MSEGITDQVTDLSKRVQALEGADTADTMSVARIMKVYGTVRMTVTVRAYLARLKYCDNGLYCDDSQFM